MKRFYKTVSVQERPDGFGVALDGRLMRTPSGAPLVLPTRRVAEVVAAEWAAQGDEVRPAAMPAMQLASTAIDRVAPLRAAVADELLRFASTDLLCYRAENPAELVRRQTECWQTIIDWAMLRFDAGLRVTAGVLPVDQPREALAALRRAVDGYDAWRLCALQNLTAATGSLLIALAVIEGRLDGEEAYEFSQLDESYQIALWGEDAEAAQRRAGLRAEILAAAEFLAAVAG